MEHFSGYGAYLLFLAIRTHFTAEKFDFFCMKVKASKETYEKRDDRSLFNRFAKQYGTTELKDFYVANILEDRHYISQMQDEFGEHAYNNYLRRRQSLSYIYTNELGHLFNKGLKVPFAVSHSTYPRIILLFLRGDVSIETLVILDDLLDFTSKFDKYYGNDIIWPRISKKIRKYRPFLKYDRDKMKDILKDVMTK